MLCSLIPPQKQWHAQFTSLNKLLLSYIWLQKQKPFYFFSKIFFSIFNCHVPCFSPINWLLHPPLSLLTHQPLQFRFILFLSLKFFQSSGFVAWKEKKKRKDKYCCQESTEESVKLRRDSATTLMILYHNIFGAIYPEFHGFFLRDISKVFLTIIESL